MNVLNTVIVAPMTSKRF
ncbi:MAG: hypothetical protein U5K55_13305 [Aliarcobacter sp.]|nr:hypothetical protein [Aliarcobacter sp.]